MSATSDPTNRTARMATAAARLARYGTEIELRAFVRHSLPQGSSEDMIQALEDGHLRHAQRRASAPPLPPPNPLLAVTVDDSPAVPLNDPPAADGPPLDT